jgi:hypothetical protein
MKQANRFDALLQIRAPEFLTEALDRAADKRLTSRSDYIRGAVLDRLRADGIDCTARAGASKSQFWYALSLRGHPFRRLQPFSQFGRLKRLHIGFNQLRARREAGEVLTDIARSYNVIHLTISRLNRCQFWSPPAEDRSIAACPRLMRLMGVLEKGTCGSSCLLSIIPLLGAFCVIEVIRHSSIAFAVPMRTV